MKFWTFTNKSSDEGTEEAELRIEGDIVSDDDSWLYELFGMPATSPNMFKAELAKFKGKPLIVWIDSFGGDVFAAAGIYNALKEHDATITVKIDGKAMSAASVIAMAGDSVLMSPVAMMMIHNPLTFAVGDMHDLRHVADVLDSVKESIVNAYQLKTKHTRAKIAEMMDNETWMSAKAAMKDGFADGMLYAEENAQNLAQNMQFNRLAFQNGVDETKRKLIELCRKREQPELERLRAELALQIEIL